MVYNGTYSGMNTSLWDPHFELPMVRSTIRDGTSLIPDVDRKRARMPSPFGNYNY